MDINRIPHHVAIIMDGNGRWAKSRGQQRSYGHQAGSKTVETIVEAAAGIGVEYLTLYTFSIENWDRPANEISALMTLLVESLKTETFLKNNIRFRVIGDMLKFPVKVQDQLNECIEATATNNGMCLVLALSYSSRWEITEAVKSISRKILEGGLKSEEINTDLISTTLSAHFMPDPDLLIRTGGEKRLSNFLLWQCAYTELYFCDTFWPDFDAEEFQRAIEAYQHRERRYGKTSEQIK